MISKIVLQWNLSNRETWEGLLAKAPGMTAYQQHWAYGAAAQHLGGRADRIVIQADGRVLGLVQLQYRRWLRLASLALAMRGPVWMAGVSDAEKSEAYTLLRHSITSRPLVFGLWMPEADDTAAMRQNRMQCVVTPYHTAALDLHTDEPGLLAQMRGKWRNRLRAAERCGLCIAPEGQKQAQYRWLLEAEAQQQKAKRYAALPPALMPLMQQHGGRGSVLVLKALRHRETVAGMLFLRHGHSATYHIGWSNEAGKRGNANNLLLWHAIKTLKAGGTRWLDLGGIATDSGPGLARFKLGTGARVHRLWGTFY
jgi:hypothetical protein